MQHLILGLPRTPHHTYTSMSFRMHLFFLLVFLVLVASSSAAVQEETPSAASVEVVANDTDVLEYDEEYMYLDEEWEDYEEEEEQHPDPAPPQMASLRKHQQGKKKPPPPRKRKLRVNQNCQCGEVGGDSDNKQRIVNGEQASPNEFPWMVAVMQDGPGDKDRQFCGGSLINSLYVVTAAHCVKGFRAANVIVRLGDHRLSTSDETNVQVRRVDKFKIHGKYNSVSNVNDIALIRMKKPAVLTEAVGTVCLPPPNLNFNGKTATVSGWGLLFSGGDSPDVLRKVEVKIIPNKDCREKYRSTDVRVSKGMICAGGSARDSCQGDSGGPMVVQGDKGRYALVGIVSMGIGCGNERFPGIYTRVSSYRMFVKANSNDGVFCKDGNLKG